VSCQVAVGGIVFMQTYDDDDNEDDYDNDEPQQACRTLGHDRKVAIKTL